MNTAVNTEAQGIGFSIPIDVAKPIMEQAVAGEELARPWIGVYYVPISPALAEAQSLPVDYGALIGTEGGQAAVFPGSPGRGRRPAGGRHHHRDRRRADRPRASTSRC